jgi:hypothetical protein
MGQEYVFRLCGGRLYSFRGDAVSGCAAAAVLVRHLEEDQVGELFEIVAIAHAVVAQRVAEAPDFGDDGGAIAE